MVTVLVLCSSVVSVVPHLDLANLSDPARMVTETVVGNAYLIAGLALICWFAGFAFGRHRRTRTIDLSAVDDRVGA